MEELRVSGDQLRAHLRDLRAGRDDLAARHQAAQAMRAAADAADRLDPTVIGEQMGRLDEQVDAEETEGRVRLAATGDPLRELDALGRQQAVEAALAALKAKRGG